MEELMKQITGSSNFQSLLANEEEGGEELLEDNDLMENAKMSYEVFIKARTASTSHSVQWLPHYEQDEQYPQFNKQYFLLGTHASEEESDQPEQVYIASIRVPRVDKSQKSVIDYTKLKQGHSSLQIVKAYNHPTEVNRARAMSQDWQTFAAIGSSGKVYLYNHTKQSTENAGKLESHLSVLDGLEEDGFGLAWSATQRGQLLGATGKRVCIWDALNSTVPQLQINDAHQDSINDARFSVINPHLFGTAASDSYFKIWDIRTPKQFVLSQKGSEDDLLAIAFSPFNEHLFITGGEESGNIQIWDMRLPSSSLNDFVYHKQQVTQLDWNPHSENIFLSCSIDGQVFIWDHSKTGEEQARTDYQDGPPELVFPHEMHQSVKLDDANWCPHQGYERMVVSVDIEQGIQIWQANDEVFANDNDYAQRLGELKDEDVE